MQTEELAKGGRTSSAECVWWSAAVLVPSLKNFQSFWSFPVASLDAPGTVLSLNLNPFCIGVLQFEQMSSWFSALVLVSPSALINQAFSAVNESRFNLQIPVMFCFTTNAFCLFSHLCVRSDLSVFSPREPVSHVVYWTLLTFLSVGILVDFRIFVWASGCCLLFEPFFVFCLFIFFFWACFWLLLRLFPWWGVPNSF